MSFVKCNEFFISAPDKSWCGKFFQDVFDIIMNDAVYDGTDRNKPVIVWKEPKFLTKLIDLKLSEEPADLIQLLKLIESTIKYSTKTGHPRFMNQLFSGLDPFGLIGQWVTDALNPSIYTYEVAPVFTLMEQEVISNLVQLVKYSEGDGMFCPGGSMANGIGINLARYNFNADIKFKGISNYSRLVIFTSEEAHYSICKMASFIGIGEKNVIFVNTDSVGRMCANDLEIKIKRELLSGANPFAVVATTGTTVRGAIDPIKEISSICVKYKLWLHVDAAWGGGLLFSSKFINKLDGLCNADSIVINPHKSLAVPQQCSLLLTKHKNILHECHSKQAEYLFQKDKFYDSSYDVGDKYLQCGRKCDVFKFWLMWKAKGIKGFGHHVENLMSTSNYFVQKITRRKDFKLLSTPDFINVCFWFIPPSLANMTDSSKLHKIAPIIKERMIKKGSMMINYQPLKQWPNFFRFVCQNSAITKDDIDFVVQEIVNLGSDL